MNTVTANEKIAEETVTTNEKIAEETVTANEKIAEETVTSNENPAEESVTTNENPVEESDTEKANEKIAEEAAAPIKEVCLNVEEIDKNFKKCVKGYHLINSSPINETMWEDINTDIFGSSGIDIYSKSDGSHLSGMDINSSFGRISNKSAKYSTNKRSIEISSYRLTTVCSEKNCGTPREIIEEINKRKNFDYYSVIVRDESKKEEIMYDWLLIPSNHLSLDPSNYTWEPMIGKSGKNKNTQVGWKTNEMNGCKMKITFSMSSQLWIHIEMNEDIKKYIIASARESTKRKYNYIELVDKLENV